MLPLSALTWAAPARQVDSEVSTTVASDVLRPSGAKAGAAREVPAARAGWQGESRVRAPQKARERVRQHQGRAVQPTIGLLAWPWPAMALLRANIARDTVSAAQLNWICHQLRALALDDVEG